MKSSSYSVVLGAHIYPAQGEGALRQARALVSWKNLTDCYLINLQFARNWTLCLEEGFALQAVLQQDSNQLCHRVGARKPVIREIFNHLARVAEEIGAEYFGFSNSDIQLTPEALRSVRDSGKTSVLISRCEMEEDRLCEICTYGIDTFFFQTAWWRKNHGRFRPYLVGEGCWDVVYASIALSEGDGLLLNREALTRHQRHAPAWHHSPFGYYNGYLAALDSLYFSKWVAYHKALEKARTRRASRGEEMELQRKIFQTTPGLGAKLYHVGRWGRAHGRFLLRKWLTKG